MYQKILDKYGLNLKDLDSPGYSGELETLNAWAGQIAKKDISIADVREHVDTMKYTVEIALVNEPEYKKFLFFKIPNQKNVFLKARLNNYLILQAFLTGPGKTRKAVERAVGNIANNSSNKK